MPLAAAIAGTAVYRFFSLFAPMPFCFAALLAVRGVGGEENAPSDEPAVQPRHVEAPSEAPTNPMRGVSLRTLTPTFDQRLTAVADLVAADQVRKVWDKAASAPDWENQPVWLHGDLHPANVVVLNGQLSGVIDFGDLFAGDPAVDLAAAWLVLPTHAALFLNAYGNADDAMIRRARGWAVHIGVGLIGIGRAWERGLPGGQPTWGRAGRSAVVRVLASD